MPFDDLRQRPMTEIERVYRLAYYATLDPDRATRVVNNTYAAALGPEQHQTVAQGDVTAFLFKTLYQIVKSDPTLLPGKWVPEINPTESPAHPLANKANMKWLDRALPGMSLGCRTMLVLWAVEGLHIRQIADVLQESVSAINQRMGKMQRHIGIKLKE